MPTTRSPLLMASIVADAMTPLMPGAGPPPTSIARVSPLVMWRMYAGAQRISFGRVGRSAGPKFRCSMETFDAVLFDLFGTLVTERAQAIEGAAELLRTMPD